MTSQTYVEFKPSFRDAPAGKQLQAVPDGERVEVSLYLKPRGSQAASREDVAAQRATDHQGDIAAVTAFAKAAGLQVISVEAGRRLIRLGGTAKQMQAAFKTTLHHFHDGKQKFRGRSGCLHLPSEIAAVTEAVLGLDTRPAASPRLVFRPAASAEASYLPNQVGKFYNYPTGVTGAGQCIGLIELGGPLFNNLFILSL